MQPMSLMSSCPKLTCGCRIEQVAAWRAQCPGALSPDSAVRELSLEGRLQPKRAMGGHQTRLCRFSQPRDATGPQRLERENQSSSAVRVRSWAGWERDQGKCWWRPAPHPFSLPLCPAAAVVDSFQACLRLPICIVLIYKTRILGHSNDNSIFPRYLWCSSTVSENISESEK